MRMTRERAEELAASNSDCHLTYIGPRQTGESFCMIGSPTTLEACGFFDDTSEWVYEPIKIEPDWTLEYAERFMGEGWYVYDAAVKTTAAFSWLTATIWKTKERAEAYLKLWKEDWWDGP